MEAVRFGGVYVKKESPSLEEMHPGSVGGKIPAKVHIKHEKPVEIDLPSPLGGVDDEILDEIDSEQEDVGGQEEIPLFSGPPVIWVEEAKASQFLQECDDIRMKPFIPSGNLDPADSRLAQDLIEKRRMSAERMRKWREKRRNDAIGLPKEKKKQPKTAAERMREYRARKKKKRMSIELNSRIEIVF